MSHCPTQTLIHPVSLARDVNLLSTILQRRYAYPDVGLLLSNGCLTWSFGQVEPEIHHSITQDSPCTLDYEADTNHQSHEYGARIAVAP